MRMILWLGLVLGVPGNSTAKEPLIVAHRGASGNAPENTIPSFKLAWEKASDAIEGDFHLTKDGQIVCIHDGNTGKVSDRNLVVKNSTLAELRKLDVGSFFDESFKGARIPTIAEVFETVPKGKKIFVEIKCGIEIVDPLLKEVAGSKLNNDQVVFICFDARVIQVLKAKAPRFKCYWLGKVQRNQIGGTNPSLKQVLASLRKSKADGFSSSRDGVTNRFIAGIRKAGFEHHVWTVNDVRSARWFADQGTISVTTDFPGRIKQGFDKKPAN